MNLISEALLAFAIGGAAAAGWESLCLLAVLLSPDKLEKLKRQYQGTVDASSHRHGIVQSNHFGHVASGWQRADLAAKLG